jgi:hypothetical protein
MLRIWAAAIGTVVMAAAAASSCSNDTATEVLGPTAERCRMSLGSTPILPAAGGNVTATVVTTRDCLWSAQIEGDWLSLEPASGQGEGPLTISSAPNPRGRARSATLDLNGQRFTIQQEPAPCRIDVTPAAAEAVPQGARLTFTVSTLEGCSWSAQTTEPWIRVVSGSGAEGSSSIEVTVDSNTGGTRTATLRIGSVGVPITQPTANDPGERCGYSLGAGAANVPAAGGERSFRVHTAAGCLWGAVSSQPWLIIVAGQNGSGVGDVRYRAEPNPTPQRRTGAVNVGTRRHVVQQAGR